MKEFDPEPEKNQKFGAYEQHGLFQNVHSF